MIVFDEPLLDTFAKAEIRLENLDRTGRYMGTVDAANQATGYRLRNRRALLTQGNDVLGVHAVRREGDLWYCYNANYSSVDIEINGKGHPRYCLMAMLSGATEMVGGPNGKTAAHGITGMIFRGLPDTRFRTTDDSARLSLWIDAGRLERALQARLGEPPREMLAFAPGFAWNSGEARAVWRMIAHLVEELRDPEGLITEPVAREAFTDLLLQTVLSRLRHNYTARLERPAGTAIPGHLRRAEAFMHACADRPITMIDVAATAGCGTATLYAAFRQFRGTTPLAALHGIRLQRVREALRTQDDQVSTRAIARRFGFTNPSRFLAAYGKRFGEHPRATRARDWIAVPPSASG